MIRRPPRSTRVRSSAASDVYKRQNLLRLTGAGVEDVAALVERHHPDLLFLQEAIEEMADLPALVGGYFFREPLEGRIYGLAVWSPHPLLRPYALRLPVSQ